jgi:SAM-dependent methyltransferase
LSFVLPSLRPGASVLDVGSGRGELVAALRAKGFAARGIDKEDGEDLFDFSGGPYDALVFVASLHHIAPLERAVAKAHSLLAPRGLLIVDDFDLPSADEAAMRLWAKIRRKDGDPVHAFRHHHEKHGVIWSALQMREAIAKRFEVERDEPCPYLFRYVHDGEDADPVLAEEASMKRLGWRLMARAR